MNCCGKKRTKARIQPQPSVEGTTADGMQTLVVARNWVQFRYDGKTALTAVGPISRQRYRFSFPGAVVDVDARDAAAIGAVPHLSRM